MTEARYPITFNITAEDAAKRLDHFLVARLPDVSRARIQQVIEQSNVLVNGQREKSSYKLRAGDEVKVLGPAQRAPLRATAEQIPLDIVFEDDDVAVINKPAGMMVHAGAGATDDARNRGTLVNALLHRFAALSQVGGALRPGIVHRLDRETSGLIVVAKNDKAHRILGEQFAAREVKKKYIALLHGWLKQDQGTIDAAISRDAVRRVRMTTRRAAGRAAVSHWKVLRRIDSPYGKFSLVEIKIDTGRTHQIRVHMSSIGHSVVGDTLYGAPRHIRKISGLSTKSVKSPSDQPLSLTRNFLHAATIEFLHPQTSEPMAFSRPLPEELESFLRQLEVAERA